MSGDNGFEYTSGIQPRVAVKTTSTRQSGGYGTSRGGGGGGKSLISSLISDIAK